ncbi:MAG: hypothetical protein ACTSRP_22300 [Candidatus Helarchaeota archaeon]
MIIEDTFGIRKLAYYLLRKRSAQSLLVVGSENIKKSVISVVIEMQINALYRYLMKQMIQRY